MKKDISVILGLVLLTVCGVILFPEYAYILLPIILIILTIYSFAANATRCPVCKSSFAKKKTGSETEVHTEIGTPSYFDDYMFNDFVLEYRCKHCGHLWKNEKDKILHGK